MTEPEARARVVETLGLVRHAVAVRPLLEIADDTGEDQLVRSAAIAALGQRPGDGAVVGLLDGLAAGTMLTFRPSSL